MSHRRHVEVGPGDQQPLDGNDRLENATRHVLTQATAATIEAKRPPYCSAERSRQSLDGGRALEALGV